MSLNSSITRGRTRELEVSGSYHLPKSDKVQKETKFIEIDANGTAIRFDSSHFDSSVTDEQKVHHYDNLTMAKYLKGDILRQDDKEIFVPNPTGSITYKTFLEMGFVKEERHEICQNILKDFPDCPELKTMNEQLKKHKGVLYPAFVYLIEQLLEMKQSFVIMFRTFGSDSDKLRKELSALFPKIKLGEKTIKMTLAELFAFKKENQNKFCQEILFVQDDHSRWKKGGEKAEFGKDFAVFPNSYFFDDNEDIVNSRHEQNEYVHPKDLPPNCKVVLVNNLLSVSYQKYFYDHIF